jgi:uncharacterized coiled-coil DUF342 family protein
VPDFNADVASASEADGSAEIERDELELLRSEVARLGGYAEALQAQLDRAESRLDEQRALVENLSAQLLERDEEISKLREEGDWRRGTEEELRAELAWRRETAEALGRELETMKETRMWRLGESYWSLKERAAKAFRR